MKSDEAIILDVTDREYACVIGALCRRYGPLKITYSELFHIAPGARIVRREDPFLRYIEYRLVED